MQTIEDKINKLELLLKSYKKVIVAFSGGVDSTFLAAAANRALNGQVVALTVQSPSLPQSEIRACIQLAKLLGIEHVIVNGPEMQNSNFLENNKQRCYWCKLTRFQSLIKWADQHDFPFVIEGTNADDSEEDRPGMRALAELAGRVKSPLRELGFSKDNIRYVAKSWGLPVWDKPSAACLVSRLNYGLPITPAVLSQVEAAEALLKQYLDGQLRVRHHDSIARIEIPTDKFLEIMQSSIRNKIVAEFTKIGYKFVVLDLAGYRTGSMNDTNDEV